MLSEFSWAKSTIISVCPHRARATFGRAARAQSSGDGSEVVVLTLTQPYRVPRGRGGRCRRASITLQATGYTDGVLSKYIPSLGVLGKLMKRRANVYGEMTHASSPPSSPSAPSPNLRNPSLLEVCMHGEKLSGNVGAPVSRFTSRFLLHPLAPFLIHWVARHSRMYEFGCIFSVFGSTQPSQMCS